MEAPGAPPGMQVLPRRALLSVSNKDGLLELAAAFRDAGVTLISTGGTARHLQAAGYSVTDVAAVTGFPEIMDGRVKTLHPKVFGGILCRRDQPDDRDATTTHGLPLFDFVVVNLYPFRETVARPETGRADAIENIDIGGPSLIRAAAKNHAWVTVLTAPGQYRLVIDQLAGKGSTSAELRRRLMVEAFRHTAACDAAIAGHFARDMAADLPDGEAVFPPLLNLALRRREVLRYGENSHQAAAVYGPDSDQAGGIVGARQLNGKQLSYNNLLDLDAAMGIVGRLAGPAVVVIKHNNPCGAATDASLAEATRRAFAGDPQSAFGGVVAMNRTVDEATARWLGETAGLFVEVIAAPGFEPEALRLLTSLPKWKAGVRLIEVAGSVPPGELEFRSIAGGMLVEERDTGRTSRQSGSWLPGFRSYPAARRNSSLPGRWFGPSRATRSSSRVTARWPGPELAR